MLADVHARLTDMPCRTEFALLAYFLRVDPALGKTLLEQALAARARTGCYRFTLSHVAALRVTPEVEAAALAHLDDPGVATDAIATLIRYGSPAAQAKARAKAAGLHGPGAP